MTERFPPEIPYVANTAILNPAHPLVATAVTKHRTIGRWAGDLSVLTRGRVPSCHWLVGHDPGQWAQMMPVTVRGNHAAGANDWSVGIEVSGGNGEPMTAWQQDAVSRILAAYLPAAGIPLAHYRGTERIGAWRGLLDHAQVATSPSLEHHNRWNDEDCATIDARVRAAWDGGDDPMAGYDPQKGGLLVDNRDGTVWFIRDNKRSWCPNAGVVSALAKFGFVPSTSAFPVGRSFIRQWQLISDSPWATDISGRVEVVS